MAAQPNVAGVSRLALARQAEPTLDGLDEGVIDVQLGLLVRRPGQAIHRHGRHATAIRRQLDVGAIDDTLVELTVHRS